ncbi:hypothetical protein ANN_21895 [Periplaneta americana]|uniref:DUF4817 domain-containing protein n=1 Tax=Periplaneta americana TaxID=6978 RepID=A0ABQ8S743_PERAM|nr:hypothetical protein ANN_21895 [Periplaneta americana]
MQQRMAFWFQNRSLDATARGRPRQIACLLTSPENIAQMKKKQELKNEKINSKKGCRISRKNVQRESEDMIEINDSDDDDDDDDDNDDDDDDDYDEEDEDVVVEIDNEGSDDICQFCMLKYSDPKSVKKGEWIQCQRTTRCVWELRGERRLSVGNVFENRETKKYEVRSEDSPKDYPAFTFWLEKTSEKPNQVIKSKGLMPRTRHRPSGFSRWTGEQRAFTIKAYYKNNYSFISAQRLLRRHYNIHRNDPIPSAHAIKIWIQNLEVTGSAFRIHGASSDGLHLPCHRTTDDRVCTTPLALRNGNAPFNVQDNTCHPNERVFSTPPTLRYDTVHFNNRGKEGRNKKRRRQREWRKRRRQNGIRDEEERENRRGEEREYIRRGEGRENGGRRGEGRDNKKGEGREHGGREEERKNRRRGEGREN